MHAKSRPLLLSAALSAALLTTLPVLASPATTATDTGVVADATVPKSQLVDRYAELAGSTDAAGTLVSTLRSGGDFTVDQQVTTTTTNPDGTTTTSTSTVQQTVANPNGPMGWGEVNITLALAQALVDAGTAPDLQSALTGTTTTVTNPDGTTTTSTSGGVLAMRASGMGWGQIARQLGFNLGTLISASHTDKAQAGNTRGHQASAQEPDHAGKPEHPAKVEHPAKPDRVERPQKPDRPERPQKPEHGGH
jgi:hypothetical protein